MVKRITTVTWECEFCGKRYPTEEEAIKCSCVSRNGNTKVGRTRGDPIVMLN